MLFTEPLFFPFMAVVWSVYWLLPTNRSRKIWLLIASYVFYGAWDWRFLLLIFGSTAVDYVVAMQMQATEGSRRKRWLLVSLCTNLGLLGFFKYFNFFIESGNSLLSLFGDFEMRTFGILLPIGISFYTFETMGYSIDVYRRRMEPCREFWDFAVYVGFFPQLVMGPILRAITFLPQLETRKSFWNTPFRASITLFLIGFIKKACISDNIAPLVDSIYADVAGFDALTLVIAAFLYAVQIYCGFSGYADIAIGIAGLLGYHVAINFDFPFFASNISDYWRRWHINFSSWVRDYLYFPLGGSRGSEAQTDCNLMITMLLSGLWHGAGAHFIVWGGLNGIALVFHRFYGRVKGIPQFLRSLFARTGVALTFYWFVLSTIFFRA